MFTVFVIAVSCWCFVLGLNVAKARSEHWSRRSIVIVVMDAVVVVINIMALYSNR